MGDYSVKIVNRQEFLTYPEGTIFLKGKKWYFDRMSVKGETWKPDESYIGDFIELDFNWPAIKSDSGEAFDTLEKSLNEGTSFPQNKSYGRDGCFDEEDLFMVYEKEDLLFLIEIAQNALKPHSTTGTW